MIAVIILCIEAWLLNNSLKVKYPVWSQNNEEN
jgi:hypothetical protein